MIKVKRTYMNCISALDALDDISKVVDALSYDGAMLEEETTTIDEKIAAVSNFLKALKSNIEIVLEEGYIWLNDEDTDDSNE